MIGPATEIELLLTDLTREIERRLGPDWSQ